MSHKLKLNVYNASNHELESYKVYHEWHGHKETLEGTNLEKSTYSSDKTITSGYNQHDNWKIDIIFKRNNNADQDVSFYCDSSHSDTGVTIRVKNKSVNCEYFKDSHPTGSCNNKHFNSVF
jgi:hypothetical protein